LSQEKIQLLTRRDQFGIVKDNIDLLLKNGFTVKVNMVVVKGMNEMEILDFIAWTKYVPIQIRLIEFMPFDGNKWNSDKLVTLQEMLELIGSQYSIIATESEPNDTSKRFNIEGHKGSFAIISTMSNPFCSTCNRIRLTADGKIKNCLFSSSETDLLTPMRAGVDILPLIKQSIASKQRELGGQFSKEFEKIDINELHNRSMIAIGG